MKCRCKYSDSRLMKGCLSKTQKMFTCDYHIHTKLSPYTDSGFSIDKIVQIQQRLGMEDIGITDHDFSYGSRRKNIERARKAIAECGASISVRLGAESHIFEYRVASIDLRFAAYFDYILMAPNHYHFRGVARPTRPLDPRSVAAHELYMFEAAIACPITDVVVHPFVLSPEAFGFSEDEFSSFGIEVMGHVDQKRLINQLDVASQRGIGIEISPKFIKYNQRHLVEFYQLCLEREVKLMIGSDAHNAKQLEELALLEPALQGLGVSEENLWRPGES